MADKEPLTKILIIQLIIVAVVVLVILVVAVTLLINVFTAPHISKQEDARGYSGLSSYSSRY